MNDSSACPYHAPSLSLPRFAYVGWILDTDQAQFIWAQPRRVQTHKTQQPHAKSLSRCPAVLDHDSRLFEVTCPIDLKLGFRRDEQGKPHLVNLLGDQSPVRSSKLGQMIALVPEKEWAHPDRPVLQIITPYVLVTDEPMYVNQLPPFQHFRQPALPGVMVSGRFPADLWPRHLMWAFEWYDTQQPIVLKRGEPWWYLRFDHFDPSRPIRMVAAEMTPELAEYIRGIKGVTNYINQTYQLFEIAKSRRPAQLLKIKTPSRSAITPTTHQDIEDAEVEAAIAAEQQLLELQQQRLHPPTDSQT